LITHELEIKTHFQFYFKIKSFPLSGLHSGYLCSAKYGSDL